MKFLNAVGPKFEGDSSRSWVTVLDFTSQVWINCEAQVNMLGSPCGSLFASVASGFKDSKTISRCIEIINHPASVFYSLALEFGKHVENKQFGREASVMTILFIKWAASLEQQESLSIKALINGFCEGMDYIDKLERPDSDPMIQCLQSGQAIIGRITCQADLLILLQEAAAITEIAAAERKSSAGSHLAGITLRAIYQALNCPTRLKLITSLI